MYWFIGFKFTKLNIQKEPALFSTGPYTFSYRLYSIKQPFRQLFIVYFFAIHQYTYTVNACRDPGGEYEGEGTLGFLINGQAWTPKGNNGTPNLGFYYDPGYKAGEFNLAAYRIPAKSQLEHFVISTDSLNFKRTFSLHDPKVGSARFTNEVCSYNRDEEVFREGNLTVTKLDLQKHIVSGTFEFTLYRAGCDTIKVTDGRFDLKF